MLSKRKHRNNPSLNELSPTLSIFSGSEKETDSPSDIFEECKSASPDPFSDIDDLDDSDAEDELKLEISNLIDQYDLMEALYQQELEPHQLELFFSNDEDLKKYLPKNFLSGLVKEEHKPSFEYLIKMTKRIASFADNFIRRFEMGVDYCDRNKPKRRSDGVTSRETENFAIAKKLRDSFLNQIYHLIDYGHLKKGLKKLQAYRTNLEFRLSLRENKLKNATTKKPLTEYLKVTPPPPAGHQSKLVTSPIGNENNALTSPLSTRMFPSPSAWHHKIFRNFNQTVYLSPKSPRLPT